MKRYKVLNVGGNSKDIAIPEIYQDFEHLILDIDERVAPDILGDARKLKEQAACSFEAVYCSHNLEHYHEHEVETVLSGFLHILKSGGFAHIVVPDIEAVINTVAREKIGLTDHLYVTRSGIPIRPLDVIYGWSKEIRDSGQDYFSHKTGFSEATLTEKLRASGFTKIFSSKSNLQVSAIAFKDEPNEAFLSRFNTDITATQAAENESEPKAEDDESGEDKAISLHEKGIEAVLAGDYHQAVRCLEAAVRISPNEPEFRINLATAHFRLRNDDRALEEIDQALTLSVDIAEAYNLKGVVLLQQKQYEKAIASFSAALHRNPSYIDCLKNLYVAYKSTNQDELALTYLEKAISLERGESEPPPQTGASAKSAPTDSTSLDIEGLAKMGIAAYEQGDFSASIDYFSQALTKAPNQAGLFNNRGLAYEKLEKDDLATEDYRTALQIDPNHWDAQYNYANLMERQDQSEAAKVLFESCLEAKPESPAALKSLAALLLNGKEYDAAFNVYWKAIAVSPNDAELHYGASCALIETGKPLAALGFIKKVLSLDPAHVDALYNRGFVLSAIGVPNHALSDFELCLTLSPNSPKVLASIADIYLGDKKQQKALPYLERAYAGDKTIKLLQGKLLHTKMHLADWSGLEEVLSSVKDSVQNGISCCQPFDLQSVTDDNEILLAASREFGERSWGNIESDYVSGPEQNDKVRIGYFSSDFGNHPVTHLIVGLIEQHDRARFEIYCFSLHEWEDDYRNRIKRAADHYINLEGINTDNAVDIVREHRIDVAINLNGYTGQNRNDLFARRVAPVQINYLGYLGTMGQRFMDYIVADRHIIPESERDFYTEKVIYLPSYQSNDDRPLPVGNQFSRTSFDLDENAFVFASFNNVYKITPDLFRAWLEILLNTPGSQLWLYARERTARDNLRACAVGHGLAAERLVFAESIDYASHMGRHHLADLFLDTFPYNGGATTSNALRSGVPVLSLSGRSFSSRYGESLLSSLDLPELVTHELSAYVDQAIRLGNDRAYHASIQAKLRQNSASSPLFNTRLFTRSLEEAYQAALSRHRQELPPAHIFPQHATSADTEN